MCFPMTMLIFVALIFCTSCGKSSFEKEREKDALMIAHVKQQDIPIPVGFTPSSMQKQNDNSSVISLCYEGNLSVDRSTSFYKKSMEFNGWEIQNFSTKKEGLLFCNKENRLCAISIRPIVKHQDSKNISPYKTNLRVLLHNTKPLAENNPENYIDSINKKQITLS